MLSLFPQVVLRLVSLLASWIIPRSGALATLWANLQLVYIAILMFYQHSQWDAIIIYQVIITFKYSWKHKSNICVSYNVTAVFFLAYQKYTKLCYQSPYLNWLFALLANVVIYVPIHLEEEAHLMAARGTRPVIKKPSICSKVYLYT